MTLTRRQILEHGSYAFLALGAGLLTAPPAAWAAEWGEWLSRKYQGGTAKVLSLKGQAQAAGQPLGLGSQVANGQELTIAPGGELLLLLPDGATFKVTGKANLTLELDAAGGGMVHLVQGGLLGVIPKLRQRAYLVRSAHATLGVKGTVFYKEVFGPGSSQDARVQAGALEYVCICNGAFDILPQGQSTALLSDQAEHHHAHLILPHQGGIQLVPASFVKGHDDGEINQVIEQNPGPKHDRAWLQL